MSKTSIIYIGDTRTAVPTAVRDKAIMLVREGHQGLVKTKKLLWVKAYFPRIEEHVKQLIVGYSVTS